MGLHYEGRLPESEVLSVKPECTQAVWTGAPTSDNRLYFGDNLPILAALLQDLQVQRKVRLIYIDPPYATNSVFHSRAQVDAYQDLLVGPHYIEFIRQRNP